MESLDLGSKKWPPSHHHDVRISFLFSPNTWNAPKLDGELNMKEN